MRLFLAIVICKLLRLALRLLGRGGTSMPGKAALRICPDVIARLSRGVETVMVTGTNGKTTTAGLTAELLRSGGRDCLLNRSGSNLRQGIAADLVENATLLGRPRKRSAVIECDEDAFKTVCGEIKPAAAVVTNLFRDQLDRYGEVTHVRDSIVKGLASSPDTLLCLNADCSLTATLAQGRRARFFGADAYPAEEVSAVSDAPRCPVCGAPYEYGHRSYAHLGAWRCPGCGAARPEPQVSVLSIEELTDTGSRATLRVDGGEYGIQTSLPGAYNLYNCAAAVTAATAMGVPAETACEALSGAGTSFGRMERFSIGSTELTVILVKNPAGCDRALEYLSRISGDFTVALALNDNEADGTDVSWIWDADFERLFSGVNTPRLIVSGLRAEDMLLRLKYAGADESAVQTVRGAKELASYAASLGGRVYLLPTYTAMLPLRGQLGRLCGRKEYWR